MSKNGIFAGINIIKVVCQVNVNYSLQYLVLQMIDHNNNIPFLWPIPIYIYITHYNRDLDVVTYNSESITYYLIYLYKIHNDLLVTYLYI